MITWVLSVKSQLGYIAQDLTVLTMDQIAISPCVTDRAPWIDMVTTCYIWETCINAIPKWRRCPSWSTGNWSTVYNPVIGNALLIAYTSEWQYGWESVRWELICLLSSAQLAIYLVGSAAAEGWFVLTVTQYEKMRDNAWWSLGFILQSYTGPLTILCHFRILCQQISTVFNLKENAYMYVSFFRKFTNRPAFLDSKYQVRCVTTFETQLK